jgi:hypothetical protein
LEQRDETGNEYFTHVFGKRKITPPNSLYPLSMFDLVYLHIGLDKTGSKAIQFSCCENVTSLSKAGIFYPITPDTVWHAEFASFFHDDPKTYDYNQAIGRSQKQLSIIQAEDLSYIRNLEQKIQQTDAKKMVLSYEGFAFLEDATLRKIQYYLAGISKEIKIILYCRDPISYAVSAISQRAISMNPLWDNVPVQNYQSICEKFIAIFDYENMMVGNFSTEGDIRKDFFNKIGFDFSTDKNCQFSKSGENRSLSAEAIVVAQALRERCKQEQIPEAEFSWRYAPILQKIKGNKPSLSAAQLTQVNQKTKEQLNYLLKTFSIDFSDLKKTEIAINPPSFSSKFIDSIAEIICNPIEFTPPLVPEVKTAQELAHQPFIGKLRCLDPISVIPVAQTFKLAVEVSNETDFHWLSKGLNPTYLSYHWQKESSEMVIFEGLRSPFSNLGLPSNQSLKANMQLIAPLEIGKYHLILTLVKENVCWFEENGFEPAKITVNVI